MIEVQDLWKSYGSFHALLGINFSVARGEILGFLGPNGAGKTTAMKILTGFMYPSSGTVRVNGLDVVDQSLAVRRLIGYLPESTPLYGDMTVTEYLRFCASLRGMTTGRARARIDQVVGRTQLLPKLQAPIKTLSKGYRQRVGIAQALLHEPEVLILDEPTVGLDPNQVVPVREIILETGRERTVILCSHILSEVEAVCGRVVIINQGTIVADGTPRDLAERLDPARTLVVRSTGEAGALSAALAHLTHVVTAHPVPTLPGTAAVQVTLAREAGTTVLAAIARAVEEAGLDLIEAAPKAATLEDVFRSLTTTTTTGAA